jgi:hypothetical protein
LAEREKKKAAGQAGGRASAQARAKAPAQAEGQAERQAKSNPVPVPDPVPKPGESFREKGIGLAGEDVHKELLATRLLSEIGDVDDATAATIRKTVEGLPTAVVVKVTESLQTQRGIRNRVAYALSSLRSERRQTA